MEELPKVKSEFVVEQAEDDAVQNRFVPAAINNERSASGSLESENEDSKVSLELTPAERRLYFPGQLLLSICPALLDKRTRFLLSQTGWSRYSGAYTMLRAILIICILWTLFCSEHELTIKILLAIPSCMTAWILPNFFLAKAASGQAAKSTESTITQRFNAAFLVASIGLIGALELSISAKLSPDFWNTLWIRALSDYPGNPSIAVMYLFALNYLQALKDVLRWGPLAAFATSSQWQYFVVHGQVGALATLHLISRTNVARPLKRLLLISFVTDLFFPLPLISGVYLFVHSLHRQFWHKFFERLNPWRRKFLLVFSSYLLITGALPGVLFSLPVRARLDVSDLNFFFSLLVMLLFVSLSAVEAWRSGSVDLALFRRSAADRDQYSEISK